MRIDRASRRVLIIVSFAALWMLAVSPRRSPLVLFNCTPSLPEGFYVRCGQNPRRGDVVAFALPPAAWRYAHLRGESTDVILIKHVLAQGGDFVSTLGGELRINGVRVGIIASIDSAGRPLPHWTAARVLSGDELLVGSSHVHSFDSRYFGPIHASQVVGVYRPLRFGFSSNLRQAGESLHDPPAETVPPIAQHVSGGECNGKRSKVTRREDESYRAR